MASTFPKSIILFAGLMFTVSGCTTTTDRKTTTLPSEGGLAPKFASLKTPMRSVAPDLAQACINSAANKYFLPTRVIKAVDSRKPGDGSTQVILKVDLRDAVCTVSSSGIVKSVIDTSPKSADQIAAEEQAAAQQLNKTQNNGDKSVAKTTAAKPRKNATAPDDPKNGNDKKSKAQSSAPTQTLY